MATEAQKKPKAVLWIGGVAVLVAIAAVIYLSQPPKKPVEGVATDEAKAYLRHLELADVQMQASENFMQQRVVEIEGKLINRGPRTLAAVDVYCLFAGADGREIHRERQRITGAVAGQNQLGPNETRVFRLPFDALPDGWNQAMPRLVIAQIVFAN
jgi:hypothetical protein